jgi:hypothetical protein
LRQIYRTQIFYHPAFAYLLGVAWEIGQQVHCSLHRDLHIFITIFAHLADNLFPVVGFELGLHFLLVKSDENNTTQVVD